MNRNFLLISPFVFALFISFTSFSPAPDKSINEDVVKYTNQFRHSKGLVVLTENEDLNAIAQIHSDNMAKGRIGFGHEGFNNRYAQAKKKISNFRAFAENVAYGPSSGKEAVAMWKNSPGHRQNMLGRYRYIGIGSAKDREGRIYYTQVFAN